MKRREAVVIMTVLMIALMSATAYADDITEEDAVQPDTVLEEPAVPSGTYPGEPPEADAGDTEEDEISDITGVKDGGEENVKNDEIIPETPENEPLDVYMQPDTAKEVPAERMSIDEAKARIAAGKYGDEIDISDLRIPVSSAGDLLLDLSDGVDEISFVDDGNIILFVMLGSVPEDKEPTGPKESFQYREQEQAEGYTEPVSVRKTVSDETFDHIEEAETQPSEDTAVDIAGFVTTVLLGLIGALKIIAASI